MDVFRLIERMASVAGWLAATLLVVVALTIGHPAPAHAGPKKFYLTVDTFQGNQALTACDNGFHMASLWEIHNICNLRYDTKRGLTQDDSGDGPPSVGSGWVRTGGPASGSSSAGFGNCDAWTSNASTDFGTLAGLHNNWTLPAQVVSPWVTGTRPCDFAAPVWCIKD
jgi:hypothetical protein